MFGLLQDFSHADLTLKDFELVEVCEFESLKHIASSERQMQFLQILSRSQQFIKWLQKETKGKYIHITYVHIGIISLMEVKFGTLLLCGLHIFISLKLKFLVHTYISSYIFLMKFAKPVASYIATDVPNFSPARFYHLKSGHICIPFKSECSRNSVALK